MNQDTIAKFNILLWWKMKGAPTFPIMSHVARGAFGFVHPCIQLEIGVKFLGCKEYANKKRSGLKPTIVNNLSFVQSNQDVV